MERCSCSRPARYGGRRPAAGLNGQEPVVDFLFPCIALADRRPKRIFAVA